MFGVAEPGSGRIAGRHDVWVPMAMVRWFAGCELGSYGRAGRRPCDRTPEAGVAKAQANRVNKLNATFNQVTGRQ